MGDVVQLHRESRSSVGQPVDRHGAVGSLSLADVDWCEWWDAVPEHRHDAGCPAPVVSRWHAGDRRWRACCELCLRASP